MTRPAHLQIEALHAHLSRIPCVTVDRERRYVLFFSFTDGSKRASVVTASGETAEEAWACGTSQVLASGTAIRWLRLDWVDAAESATWGDLRRQLTTIKRNYFRLGIALDPKFRHAFLEVELNANAMLYGGPGQASAVLNEKNFARYAARRHGLKAPSFANDGEIWLFTTGGLFVGDDGVVHTLEGGGLDAGRRKLRQLSAADVGELVVAGSAYLARQMQENGRFHYGWHPSFDRPIPSYNALRHASTLYAMLEAWEVTRDEALKDAIRRGLACLTRELIRPAELPGGDKAAFLVDTGDEIKLGGNAVAILALAKHAQLTGEREHLPLLDALATGIVYMQDAKSGQFWHVLNYPALNVKQAFRIIYYDGEAAFALMRLHELTGDLRWLAAVEKAFEYFIRAEHWKAHDHWLSYCVNELTMRRPEERYYRFAIDNFRDYLGFVRDRITTFPTLLELMMAAQRTIARMSSDPALAHLLGGVDLALFDQALHRRARHQLNGHFWPELAMFYAKPDRIVGSFFIRHHAFRVRIDDVEHYLSGLVAYRRHLLETEAQRPAAPVAASAARIHWTADDVERATGGRWLTAPGPGWFASGLCISPPTMQAGEMVAVRLVDPGIGIAPQRLVLLKHLPSALIVSDPAAGEEANVPVLVVADTGAAILAMGHYARDRMRGRLVAVTGSAGKTTTVAMMAHALSAFGAVGQTRANANLPHGVAWNLASIPWDVPHTVLELAIGRMARTARLARPDVAIFTNILPAHLEYHRDLATVATRKSAIFEGMRPGRMAVLNRDMAEWDRVHVAAKVRGLSIIHYGHSEACDARLVRYDPHTREVLAQIHGRPLSYRLGAQGEHMALNSVAVLAAVSALGEDLAPALATLESFSAASGRGKEVELVIEGRRLTVIDDAYNANPGSMAAALAALGARPASGRRIAVLGEMLELGPQSAAYHAELAPLISRFAIDQVHALGTLYASFWQAVPAARRGVHASSLDEIRTVLRNELQDGDTVLLKGSHGTGMYNLPDWLRSHVAAPEAFAS